MRKRIKTPKQTYKEACKNFEDRYQDYMRLYSSYVNQPPTNVKQHYKLNIIITESFDKFRQNAWDELSMAWLLYENELKGRTLYEEKSRMAEYEYKVDLARYWEEPSKKEKLDLANNLKADQEKKQMALASLQYYEQIRATWVLIVTAGIAIVISLIPLFTKFLPIK